MKTLIFVVALLARASIGSAIGPAWYSCDPAKCTGTCHCPSQSAPGGLPPADTPQFVIITHDDAIDATANRAVRSLTDGYKNSNGCNVAATWFVTQAGTDCTLAKKLWQENHEIALHTVNHAQLVSTLKDMKDEILGVRTFLNQSCGIPLTDMLGFRSPYLVNNPKVRSILTEAKLLYDSSITESIGPDSLTSNSFGQRLFPYTMDNGIVQNCNWTYPDGQCTQNERYPGFWEIPMWNLPFSTEKTQVNAYSMDPDAGFGGDLFTTLTTNFDQAYTGNRAPFPIYVHAPWFTPSHVASAKKFVEYALAKPNVYFVTIQQLLKWMQNPVPASQMASFLSCNSVSVKAPAPPPPCQVYTIENGDFIDLIAGKFGVDPKDLLALNPTVTPMSIQPGQKLKIPPWTANCQAGGVPARAGTATAPTAAVNTSGMNPATTPQAAPAGADPESAFNPSSAPDRLEMDFVLIGLSKNGFDVSGHNQIINSLAQMLEVFPDRIFVSSTVAARRRRAMLQDPAVATPALNVHAVVAAEDPAALYFKALSEIDRGEFEGSLTALGFSARAPPTLKAYLGNVEMQPMAPTTPTSGAQTPAQPQAQAQAAEKKSSLPLGAIIGIAVGGGVALILVIVGTVLLVRRSRAHVREVAYDKHHDDEEEAGSNGFGGVLATLKVRTSWKGSDSSFVLKGETPTSATFRNNATVNNAFRV